MLLDDVCRIVGAREWLDEFRRVDEGNVILLLGKGVEDIWRKWESAYCIGWIDSGREGSSCMVRLLLDIGPPLSFLEQLIDFNLWINFYLVCHLELGS